MKNSIQAKNLLILGQQIRQARLNLGWSQEKLAFEANIDRSYIGGVERGERNIAINNLCNIAKALSISVSELTKNLPSLKDSIDE